MKNIFKLMFVFIAAGALFVACDNDKTTYFDEYSQAIDASAPFYLQFNDNLQTGETGVSLTGGLIEVQYSIAIAVMGAPQNQDISLDLTLDPASTLESDMFTLSATSVTIPAGKTSVSVDFSTVAANMPVGEELKFILNLDAGLNNSPNANGTKLTYNVKRIEFCPLENGVADLVGSWSGTDGTFWASKVVTVANGDDLDVTGLSFPMMEGWWGEPIVAGGTFTMTVQPNGLVDIPKQYIYTSTYKGTEYRYEVEGSGKWTNCGDKPTLLFTYDIYYEGDAIGLAANYASYLDGTGYFTADLSLSGSSNKASSIIQIPAFK